jgi:hypothetical protein
MLGNQVDWKENLCQSIHSSVYLKIYTINTSITKEILFPNDICQLLYSMVHNIS